MTSRQRMTAALEGRPVDQIPIAPFFWGAEYVWKLMDKPIWEVLHGAGDMRMQVLEALDTRHGCDWVVPLHWSSGILKGKTYTREDSSHAYFTDDETGEEWVFHKEGHWLVKKSEIDSVSGCNPGVNVEPPSNKTEADDWLKQRYSHLESEPQPRTPDLRLRERFPDRFLVGGVMAPFAAFAYDMGFEPTLILLHENPSLCAYMIEKTMAHVPAQCRALAEDGYDAGLMTDSWASADIMSPATYQDWVAPLHKMMSDELHKVGLKSIMYNTGNVLPLMESVNELGFDAIAAEERIKGVEIDVADIRNRLGTNACLFGNFDSYLLMRGERELIKKEVERQVKSAGPGSFVMGTGSPVCDATDPDVVDFWIGETRGISCG